ncbi:MAG: hypothetical protein WA843_04215 [Candidatus Saccharimonadales bacterium]
MRLREILPSPRHQGHDRLIEVASDVVVAQAKREGLDGTVTDDILVNVGRPPRKMHRIEFATRIGKLTEEKLGGTALAAFAYDAEATDLASTHTEKYPGESGGSNWYPIPNENGVTIVLHRSV